MISRKKMIASSFLFGMGWFAISFAFPLEAVHYNLGDTVTGLLGLSVSVPFPIAALFYLRSGDRYLFPVLVATQLIIALVVFLLVLNSYVMFITMVMAGGILQGLYWVTMEVSIGSVSGVKNAEAYSAAWGTTSFFSPVLAGFILEYYSFRILAILSAIILAASVPFVQRYEIGSVKHASESLSVKNVLPLLFAGIVLGYFSYTLLPLLRISGLQYTTLGILGSVLGGSMALGFVLLNIIDEDNIMKLNIVAGVLMAIPLLIAFSRNIYLLFAVTALAGFGIAIAFSKVLAYIFRTSDPIRGTFYYELFIAIGFGSGSAAGGTIAAFLGFNSALVVFIIPALYPFFIIRNRDLRYHHSA